MCRAGMNWSWNRWEAMGFIYIMQRIDGKVWWASPVLYGDKGRWAKVCALWQNRGCGGVRARALITTRGTCIDTATDKLWLLGGQNTTEKRRKVSQRGGTQSNASLLRLAWKMRNTHLCDYIYRIPRAEFISSHRLWSELWGSLRGQLSVHDWWDLRERERRVLMNNTNR